MYRFVAGPGSAPWREMEAGRFPTADCWRRCSWRPRAMAQDGSSRAHASRPSRRRRRQPDSAARRGPRQPECGVGIAFAALWGEGSATVTGGWPAATFPCAFLLPSCFFFFPSICPTPTTTTLIRFSFSRAIFQSFALSLSLPPAASVLEALGCILVRPSVSSPRSVVSYNLRLPSPVSRGRFSFLSSIPSFLPAPSLRPSVPPSPWITALQTVPILSMSSARSFTPTCASGSSICMHSLISLPVRASVLTPQKALGTGLGRSLTNCPR